MTRGIIWEKDYKKASRNLHLDERGDTLSTIIVFPVVLLMIFWVLQIWFWSSARTTAQIAADEALRTAQNSVIENRSDGDIAKLGFNSGIAELDNEGSFISAADDYVECEGLAAASPAVVRSEEGVTCSQDVLPEEICDSRSTPTIEVGVDDDQIVVCVNVNSYALTVPIPRVEISVLACGAKVQSGWAPNRLTTDIATSENEWGQDWTC